MITASDATGARFALVTGTTRGIGAAVVERLLERGWSVIGLARHPATFEDDRYRHLSIDLAETGTLAETIEREVGESLSNRRWTRIGLVSNAATSGVLAPIESTDPAALLRCAAVNWVAPAWLIAFVLRNTPPPTPAHRQCVVGRRGPGLSRSVGLLREQGGAADGRDGGGRRTRVAAARRSGAARHRDSEL
jgi:NAD(P)-dependent dehydrogenase (short-subunit alcohol dehydrogenase family)